MRWRRLSAWPPAQADAARSTCGTTPISTASCSGPRAVPSRPTGLRPGRRSSRDAAFGPVGPYAWTAGQSRRRGVPWPHHRHLRAVLHHVSEAPDNAEYRSWRRSRRLAAGYRLGGGDRKRRSRRLSLFLIIFLWTPPHFWALAICRSSDYERASIPMLPVVVGPEETARQIFIYSVVLVAASFLPCRCSGLEASSIRL